MLKLANVVAASPVPSAATCTSKACTMFVLQRTVLLGNRGARAILASNNSKVARLHDSSGTEIEREEGFGLDHTLQAR